MNHSNTRRPDQRAIAGAIAALVLTAAVPAAAQDRQARTWAASCAACHGTDGRSAGGIAALAGRNADELARLLNEYRTDKRPGTVMHQHAKGYTEAELRRIAEFFAAQKP